MAKKRKTTRKAASSTRRAAKAARPARKKTAARRKATRPRGSIDFNPIKKRIREEIQRLEHHLGGAEARAAIGESYDEKVRTLDRLKGLNRELTGLCFPTMVFPPNS